MRRSTSASSSACNDRDGSVSCCVASAPQAGQGRAGSFPSETYGLERVKLVLVLLEVPLDNLGAAHARKVRACGSRRDKTQNEKAGKKRDEHVS